MEIRTFRDNELITGISILAVLRYTRQLELSKCLLIEPMLSYTRVLNALKRSNSSIKSIEDFVIKEDVTFSNFNTRYQDSLILSVNSILLFKQMKLVDVKDEFVLFTGGDFDFSNSSLGNKAASRIKASKKLAELLQKGEASDLYLSLRIEL